MREGERGMEERRVRICDLAEELGLSTATVSNVIHGKTKKVSDATVQRVTALLEEREYIPNMAGISWHKTTRGSSACLSTTTKSMRGAR